MRARALYGARHEGVLDRVGADFVEVRPEVGRVQLVSYAALSAVASRD